MMKILRSYKSKNNDFDHYYNEHIYQKPPTAFLPMKLIDMYFWSIGYKLNSQEKNG